MQNWILIISLFCLSTFNLLAEDRRNLGEMSGITLSYSEELKNPQYLEYEGKVFASTESGETEISTQLDFVLERYVYEESEGIVLLLWRNNKAGQILRLEAFRIVDGQLRNLSFDDKEFIDLTQGEASLDGGKLTARKLLVYYVRDESNASIEYNYQLQSDKFALESVSENASEGELGQLEMAAYKLDSKEFAQANEIYESMLDGKADKIKAVSEILHDQVCYDYARSLVGAGQEAKAKEVLQELKEKSAFYGRARVLMDTL